MADPSPAWYDCIVVGCGGLGSSALYRLSKQIGPHVLGIEQFRLGHDNGGSQDHSRTIRNDYTDQEHIRLCSGAYDSWEEVEADSGLKLVYNTGGVNFAEQNTTGARRVEEMEKKLKEHGIRCERLDGELLTKRFPQFNPNLNYVALHVPDNGVLDAALANAVHVQLARKYGATIVEETKVTGVSRSKEGALLVRTNRGDYMCRRLIVTAGAWANSVLESVGVHVPLIVTQEQITYFATPYTKEFTKDSFPCWSFQSPDNKCFYGLPIHGNTGTKIGTDAEGAIVTPETRTFKPSEDNLNACKEMLKRHIPHYLGPVLQTKTCLYAMTPDRHFVIDTCHRTGFPDVIVCCGAGHAFKFASIFGEILTELATKGRCTGYDLEAFALNRSAITDKNYRQNYRLETSKL